MTFLYIVLALVVLLILITVHEFGHYTAGKIFGFKINEFSIGFGPKIYQKVNKKTGEVFSIRALPLGGYCAFEGEDEDNPSKDAFNNKSPWRRLIVLVSGVLFNFIFGVITAAIFLMSNGYGVPVIQEFAKDNVNTQFMVGDKITAVDGKSIEAYRSFTEILRKIEVGEEISVTVLRDVDGKTQEIVLDGVKKYETTKPYFYLSNLAISEGTVFDKNGIAFSYDEINSLVSSTEPALKEGSDTEYLPYSHNHMFFKKNADGSLSEYTDEEFVKLAGVTMVSEGSISFGILYYNGQARYGFFESLLKAVPFCFYMCWLILTTLAGLFTGVTKISSLGGTITAISEIANYSKMGINAFLVLLPMLSMNLALFNILPIPALDGARCIFVLIEWIFRKPVPRKVENMIHNIGLIVLLGLVVFLDIYHFFFAPKAISALTRLFIPRL